jgi:outer membrane autotransporter protein
LLIGRAAVVALAWPCLIASLRLTPMLFFYSSNRHGLLWSLIVLAVWPWVFVQANGGQFVAESETISDARTTSNGGYVLDGLDTLIVTATGSIDTTGSVDKAIATSGDGNTISVSGALATDGASAYAVYNIGDNNLTTLLGTIQTSGSMGDGVRNHGNENITEISGELTILNVFSQAVINAGDRNVTNIAGTIDLYNAFGSGISNYGDNNIVNLSGTVRAMSLYSKGILNYGNGNSYYLNGLVAATAARSYSIYNEVGINNIYRFGEGVRVIGDIYMDDVGGTDGNTLKFDVGSALSYVYDTTGSWTLEDLDGRSVVAGSAMAAGIGNAETADELQYLRLSQINHSLLNRADRYALVDGERQAWADPFYFNSERDASRTDATIEDYDADGYGLTVGLPIVLKSLDADVILGVQETALDIHSGTQNIDVTSLRAGLYFPNLLTQDAIRVSGKALIGYNQHDMDRQVLVNSNTTTGITTYTADYDSWEAVAGLEAEHSQPLGTGATTLTASLGADLVYEAIESYDETANFHWDSRDLLQGVAKASLGLHHVHTNGMKTYAIASVQARDVLDGKVTDYAINGTAVNFSGGDFNDTITQLNLGATYQAKENLQLGLNLQAARSDNDIDSYAASARLNWKF